MSKQIIYLLFIILIFMILVPMLIKAFQEGFDNYILATPGSYPSSENSGLLNCSYPSTGNKEVSTYSASDIWWHYPIFKVGSYMQITNNLKYPNNPDEGTCSRAEFCGALYREKQMKSNISVPLPPVPQEAGTRINYYNSSEDILLPNFKTDGLMAY